MQDMRVTLGSDQGLLHIHHLSKGMVCNQDILLLENIHLFQEESMHMIHQHI
jgi:hypothetical protein